MSSIAANDFDKSMKVVVLGDETSGKTKMLVQFCRDSYDDYSPGEFDSYNVPLTVKDTFLYMSIWDTPESSKYDSIRPLAYSGTHVFVVCYSIFDEKSYENVKTKWVVELNKHCPGAPIVLVGTDYIFDKPENIKVKINHEQEGLKLSTEIGAARYVQYSFQNNPESVFVEAASVAFDMYTKSYTGSQEKCIIS